MTDNAPSPMQTLKAIHQFAVTCSTGDGITNGMLFTQRLIRACGLPSEIYVIDAPDDMKGQVHAFRNYRADEDDLLLIHHGSGNGQEQWLQSLTCRKLMVYHNITPERFYDAHDPAIPVLRHGREQLRTWQAWLDGAIADSDHNRDELRAAGFSEADTTTLPLLVDLQRLQTGAPLPQQTPRDSAAWRILFVGRLAPNKNQAGLIAMLAEVRRRSAWPVMLTLAGGGSPETLRHLESLIERHGLADSVELPGKIDDAQLARLYQQADLYVSLSEHEGFGMPLIEAMSYDVPVLAYAAPDSSVAATLGQGGLLLDSHDPTVAAAATLLILRNPGLRARLIDAQRQRLEDFEPATLFARFRAFLAQRGMEIPELPASAPALPGHCQWRIEGPFDSSYSLALVNRELSRALARQGQSVALHATEGGGDIPVDSGFLDADPEIAALNARAGTPAWHDATLRLCYPPRTTEMAGRHRLIHTYGWEESVFPHEHAQAFNARLSMITTMSRYVSRTLVDSGVGLPLPVAGVGTDHYRELTPEPEALAGRLPAADGKMTFLHVSSCFPRKGVDVLLEAWYRAFDQDDGVRLVIKTFPNPHHRIEETLADRRRQHPQGAPVVLINEDLSAGAVRALYAEAHALVAPSRGEGFGLPMAEAMWCRLPVITTGQGGQTDFCTPETSWPIDFDYARAQTHMQQFASVWAEPSVDDLIDHLRTFAAHHRDGTLENWTAERCEAAYRRISQAHTWDAVAERTRDALRALDDGRLPVLTPRPRIGWVSSWGSKCGIATYSRLLVDPALNQQVHVLANSDAEKIVADHDAVTRCWRTIEPDGQGGHIEDSLDELYATIREAGLDTVVVQFNFSFFGLAALSRLLERLHADGVRTLVFFHSTADVHWGELHKSLAHMADALRGCTRLMVHGIDDLNRLKAMGLDANATLFPHGVMASPAIAPPESDTFRALRDKTVVASYGFLLPHKGVHELIEAFAMLADTRDDLHLLLLNALYPAPVSEAERERCRATIARLGLESRVTLINDFLPDDETLGWLQAADLLVFPYQQTQESSSAAVRWGLASGRPVLCTPLGIFDDVADAVGFLPSIHPEAMRAGMAEWLDDEPRRRQLQNGAARWLNAHDWPRLSQRLKGLITGLAWPALDDA